MGGHAEAERRRRGQIEGSGDGSELAACRAKVRQPVLVDRPCANWCLVIA